MLHEPFPGQNRGHAFFILGHHVSQKLTARLHEERGAARADGQVPARIRAEAEVIIRQSINEVDVFEAPVQRGGYAQVGLAHLGGYLHAAVAALDEEPVKLLRRHGPGEVIALDDIAAHGLQGQQLFLGLDALGHHGHLEIIGNIDDELDHAHIPGLTEGVAHKGHIQLQRVNGQVGEHPQRGVARAEIIHLDTEAHAHAPQLAGGADDLIGVPRVGGLGDLQNDVVRAEVVGVQNPPEYSLQVRHQHIDAGHVHRHGHGKAVGVLPLPDLPRGLLPHIAVQLQDQAVVLQQGNKDAGADQTHGGVIPADQRLGTGEDGLVGADIEFRLEVDLEAVLLDGGPEILQQLLLVQGRLVQGVVVLGHRLHKAALDAVRGHLGPVEAAVEIQRLVGVGVHAHAQTHPVLARLVAAQALGGGLQQGLIVLPVGAVDEEDVAAPAAADAVRLQDDALHPLADAAENVVAVHAAITLVDHVEVVHIHHHRVHGLVGVMGVVHPHIPAEEVQIVQPRQGIPFGKAQGVAVFRQLNALVHPGQNDLLGRVGLGQKVHGADF